MRHGSPSESIAGGSGAPRGRRGAGGIGADDLVDVLVVGVALAAFDLIAAYLLRRLGHPIGEGVSGVGSALRALGFSALLAVVLVGLQSRGRAVTRGAAVQSWVVIVLILAAFYFIFPVGTPQHDPVRSVVIALGAAGAAAGLYARRKSVA